MPERAILRQSPSIPSRSTEGRSTGTGVTDLLVTLLLGVKGKVLGHLLGSSGGVFYSRIAEFRLLLVFEMIHSFKAVYCSYKFCIV